MNPNDGWKAAASGLKPQFLFDICRDFHSCPSGSCGDEANDEDDDDGDEDGRGCSGIDDEDGGESQVLM